MEKIKDNLKPTAGLRQIAAHFALRNMQRQWLSALPFEVDAYMVRLFLSIYCAWVTGSPLHKKAAFREMGLEEIKTSRKYFAIAEKNDLIQITRFEHDKRKELLLPTEKLQKLIEHDIDQYLKSIFQAVEAINDTLSQEMVKEFINRKTPITQLDGAIKGEQWQPREKEHITSYRMGREVHNLYKEGPVTKKKYLPNKR